MTNNERLLRQRISQLDERILVLESIFQDLFDILNNTLSKPRPSCNTLKDLYVLIMIALMV